MTDASLTLQRSGDAFAGGEAPHARCCFDAKPCLRCQMIRSKTSYPPSCHENSRDHLHLLQPAMDHPSLPSLQDFHDALASTCSFEMCLSSRTELRVFEIRYIATTESKTFARRQVAKLSTQALQTKHERAVIAWENH